jgi:hypothetical protein
MGCAFMAYTGLIIHQTGGDIEVRGRHSQLSGDLVIQSRMAGYEQINRNLD